MRLSVDLSRFPSLTLSVCVCPIIPVMLYLSSTVCKVEGRGLEGDQYMTASLYGRRGLEEDQHMVASLDEGWVEGVWRRVAGLGGGRGGGLEGGSRDGGMFKG